MVIRSTDMPIIIIFVIFVVVVLIIGYFGLRRLGTPTPTTSPTPTTQVHQQHTGPDQRILGSGVSCGGTDPGLVSTCETGLVCSDVWRVCTPSTSTTTPPFIPDPSKTYIIRVVSTSGSAGANTLAAFVPVTGTSFVAAFPLEIVRRATEVLYQWRFVYVPEGNYYAILNTTLAAGSNTMTADTTTSVIELHGENWDQDQRQRFIFQPVANHPGTYAIVNPLSSRALSNLVQSFVTLAPANWDNDPSQRFIISEVA